MLDHMDRAVGQRPFVELREVPAREEQREDGGRGHRMGGQGEDPARAGRSLQPRVEQHRGDAGCDEGGGDVDEQHVLQHVRGEQVPLAQLVQGRADGDIGGEGAEMEADGGADRIGGARGDPSAQGPAGHRVKPHGRDEGEHQQGLGVPMEGKDHRSAAGQARLEIARGLVEAHPADEAGLARPDNGGTREGAEPEPARGRREQLMAAEAVAGQR